MCNISWTKLLLLVSIAAVVAHGKNLFSTRATLIEDVHELPLNLTRSHDGDVIIVKGEKKCWIIFGAEISLFSFASRSELFMRSGQI